MSIVITGIHTGIGKTICSAVICQALGYDYFKPIQAGDLEMSDSITLKNLVSNSQCMIHPESYRLQIPASPHYAAEQEGITIEKEKIVLPQTQNNLLVETAGGVMSPLTKNFLNLDLIAHFALPVILVSNNYLGSINHTLMSFLALQSKNIDIKGIVFSGEKNAASESFILEYTQLPLLFSIPQFVDINSQSIARFAQTISIEL